MATLVTRTTDQPDGTTAKGSELTHAEVDANFINLNSDKVEVSGAIVFAAKAGEALTKGDVVYVSGVSGNNPVVSKADADDASKMPAFGLAEDDANNNAAVNVVTFGTLYELDTSSFTAGDTVYVSTTAGGLTATKPTGEASLIQNIGKVIRSHASAGSIKVGGAGRSNDVPNLDDGNVFIGNASNQAEARALTGDDISGGTITSFASTGIDDNATSTAITIDSSENVGIGGSPVSGSRRLMVKDSGDARVDIRSGADTNLGAIDFSDTSNTARGQLVYDHNDDSMQFKTLSAERMRIDGSGNVGIGTSTPNGALHVQNTTNLNADSNFDNRIAPLVVGDGDGSNAALLIDGNQIEQALTSDRLYLNYNSTADTSINYGGGNVAIGTTGATSKLHVYGSNGAGSRIHIQSTGAGTQTFDGSGSGLLMTAGGMNTTSKFTPAVQFGSTDPQLTTTNPKVGAAINGYATETYASDTDGGMGLVFYTRPNNDGADQDVTERMRITEAGSVCVGDDDPDQNGPRSALYVCSGANNTGVSSNTYRPDIFVGASSTAGGSGAGGEIRFGARVYGTSGFAAFKGYITDGAANYNVGYLDLNMRASNTSASMTRRYRFNHNGDFHADGNVVAYSTSVSDERFKDDVQPITGALDTVDALQGVTFTWNAGSRGGQRDYGLIAQEVEKVLPEVVHESAMPLMTDGDNETLYKTIDYDKLVSVLINAVSELRAEVEALKSATSN